MPTRTTIETVFLRELSPFLRGERVPRTFLARFLLQVFLLRSILCQEGKFNELAESETVPLGLGDYDLSDPGEID